MTNASMQHIPLASAYLCPDCNCVGNCSSQRPACAPRSFWLWPGVLDREVTAKLV